MAQVKKNQLVYDPFVGSGGLLISAAHYDAYVMGADLDYNLIHSKGLSSRMGQKYRKQEETIRNNLKQYDLEDKFLDVLVADFSTTYIKNTLKFDSIVTDPPYGIREKAKKIGSKNNQPEENVTSSNKPVLVGIHLPQHTRYKLGEIFYDLLSFSAQHLSIGSRLVFWMPVYLEIDRSLYKSEEINEILRKFIPMENECLDLISFSEQRLTRFTSRILITMKRNGKNSMIRVKANSSEKKNDTSNPTVDEKLDILNKFRDNYFNPRNSNKSQQTN